MTIEDDIGFATISFVGANIAIECILDCREMDVGCKVARVINGAVPTPLRGG